MGPFAGSCFAHDDHEDGGDDDDDGDCEVHSCIFLELLKRIPFRYKRYSKGARDGIEVKRVSWIRRRDWHILTSGRHVYTNDDRFQIDHTDGSEEWTLLIKYVQTRDQGPYDCQVSSTKGIISHLFNLNVLVPQAHILGAKEYHVQRGTVISLVCIIENYLATDLLGPLWAPRTSRKIQLSISLQIPQISSLDQTRGKRSEPNQLYQHISSHATFARPEPANTHFRLTCRERKLQQLNLFTCVGGEVAAAPR
ncbi:Opioid-binding protein/cell adhesion molecule [Orchesella cincta]|uniref:Opioid-binding protein/cell adhesion molecule n=1 Tax=Orchesella cincta TaxID=48709 RepID=A0A1D2NMY6_ORCCI|nr:Opioid-binding protein/cell adhesion molecule [Orchesella cincta]